MTIPRLHRRALLTGGAALGAVGLASLPLSPALAGRRRTQLAFLNHSYAVLDAETFAALGASSFLHTFAAYDERTTSNGDQTYSGRYLLGRRTYVETFAEGALPAPDDRLGATGLALSPDRSGLSTSIKQRLVELGATEPVDLVQTKLVAGEQIPWFRLLTPSLTYQAALPWVMEYEASYFADPRTNSEPATFPGDVSRERYNPDTYRQRLARDVVGLEIDVPAADMPALRTVLLASGLRVRDQGATLTATGRSEVVVLRASSGRLGWRRVVFELNEPARRTRSERIGRSQLRVGPGPLAVWTFA